MAITLRVNQCKVFKTMNLDGYESMTCGTDELTASFSEKCSIELTSFMYQRCIFTFRQFKLTGSDVFTYMHVCVMRLW